MKKTLLVSLFILLTSLAMGQAASLIITEFMASNSNTITDADGNYSDWLEIFNPTSGDVSFSGCYLTDDADNFIKGRFQTLHPFRPWDT